MGHQHVHVELWAADEEMDRALPVELSTPFTVPTQKSHPRHRESGEIYAKGHKTLVQSLHQKLKTQFVDTSNYDDIIVETEKATKKHMHVSGKPNAFKVWDALERDKVTEAVRALTADKGCNVSKVWRVARSAEWAKLSEEEQKVYEEKAESWCNGTLDDKTKMKLREQRMMQYLKKFAKTMWDTMGIHMAFMLAYPKEAGSLKVEMVEVNHAITNGTPFGAYPGWLCAYQPLAKVFSEWAKGEYGVTETTVTVKKTPADCMRAMDKIQLTANSFPLLPSVPEGMAEAPLKVIKVQVRDFMNHHYALAKGVRNCKSPWMKLNSIDDINKVILAEMLPENFQWIDPSKMTSVPVLPSSTTGGHAKRNMDLSRPCDSPSTSTRMAKLLPPSMILFHHLTDQHRH
ncbi:hypothetical protein SCP_0411140 [Sparassis crispa]|uniref:Uncharacterized protein n=1 Tax=Sparassis crispa TaxID=139825 RepID=A0A401GKQ4_9APHY|nr:hypothetical protein SCP_0411140 [Sparassis crispa]GBE82729.1 hypothetical protein SCP_0411140 [Sparassis crispa]